MLLFLSSSVFGRNGGDKSVSRTKDGRLRQQGGVDGQNASRRLEEASPVWFRDERSKYHHLFQSR
jgi:hypothetical protein